MPKFPPIPIRVASHLLFVFYNLLITLTFILLTLIIFYFPLLQSSMPDDSPMTPRVFHNDAQRTSPLLQRQTWAPEPDRLTNAASINTVKWEPPPIREPCLFLTLYPLLFI